MTASTSSARPIKLFQYAEVALYIDGVLLKEANNLAVTLRQFEATCNELEFAVPVSHLTYELQDYVRRVRELDEWVGEVGIGFARADVNSLLSILNLLHIPVTGRNLYVGTDILRRILDRYSSSWISKLGLNLVSLRLMLGRGKTLFELQQERYAQLGLAVVGGWGGKLYAHAVRNPWLFAGPGDGRPHRQGGPPRGGHGGGRGWSSTRNRSNAWSNHSTQSLPSRSWRTPNWTLPTSPNRQTKIPTPMIQNRRSIDPPPKVHRWIKKIIQKVPALVPEEGTRTYSLPIFTGGSVIYVSLSLLQANISSNGDVLITGSVEGGAMLSAGVSLTGALQKWNTKDVDSLIGWYGVVGGSAGEGLVAGAEYDAFDSTGPRQPGGKVSSIQRSMGIGSGLPVEAHFGPGYTWPYLPKFNILSTDLNK